MATLVAATATSEHCVKTTAVAGCTRWEDDKRRERRDVSAWDTRARASQLPMIHSQFAATTRPPAALSLSREPLITRTMERHSSFQLRASVVCEHEPWHARSVFV